MKIIRLQTGRVQIKTRHVHPRRKAWALRMLDIFADPDWAEPFPMTAWAIDHPDGLIVVDTGETAKTNAPGYRPWWHPFLQFCEREWQTAQDEVGPALRRAGYDPDQVRWVVMTHMHLDHAGGIDHFPNAEFVVTATEIKAALSIVGPIAGYLNRHYPGWFKPRQVTHDDGPWESFDRHTRLTRDGSVRLVPTPGHTMGHQSVVVDQGDHLVLIGGDAAYSETALLKGTVDGVADSFAAHEGSTARLRALCRSRPTITQFTHDPDSQRRLDERIMTTPT